MKQPTITSLKADLAAANAEAKGYLDQVIELRKNQRAEAERVESEYAALVANLSAIVRHVADIAATMAGKVAKR